MVVCLTMLMIYFIINLDSRTKARTCLIAMEGFNDYGRVTLPGYNNLQVVQVCNSP